MAAACGLQSVRDVLLVSYFEDAIDEVEFTVLYEENYSREIFPQGHVSFHFCAILGQA